MYRKSLFIPVIVVLILSVGAAAFAQGPRPGAPGLARQFASARVQARLNLTPDQVRQIQEIVKAQRAAAPPAPKPAPAAAMAQEHQALMKAIFTDSPNQDEIAKHEAALVQQQAAVAQQHQKRLDQMIGTLLQINRVLTPAQRAEFQKMLDENARAGQIMRGRMMMRQGMNGRRRPAAAPQPPPPPPDDF
jgi:Spy/CpxP family protein refolding chaperone